MAVIKDLIEGETAPFTFALEEDGAAIDGTGLTLNDPLITGSDTTAVTTTSKLAWASQSAGTVTYSPGSTEFEQAKSPYKIRCKVTDGDGKVRYYPNGASAEIVVRKVRS